VSTASASLFKKWDLALLVPYVKRPFAPVLVPRGGVNCAMVAQIRTGKLDRVIGQQQRRPRTDGGARLLDCHGFLAKDS